MEVAQAALPPPRRPIRHGRAPQRCPQPLSRPTPAQLPVAHPSGEPERPLDSSPSLTISITSPNSNIAKLSDLGSYVWARAGAAIKTVAIAEIAKTGISTAA